MTRTVALTLLLLAILAGGATAKNVDLTTLPSRDTVQLTIYNSEDLTLVKETRYLTLKKGSNQLQFSWANTLIDPTSVEIRALRHVDEIEVADTVFPGQKPQHLIWNIQSQFEGQVPVEVTYFTSGLTWTMDYVVVTDPGETSMDFDGFVRVYNRSGEEYEHAEVRLIVGKINLVEKIAALARRQGIPMPQPGEERFRALKEKAGRRAFAKAEAARDMAAVQEGEKAIVKEGLSEYFMFSVEGTETIRNGWSKRMRAVQADQAKFTILYRMRAHQYGPRPVRFFLWQNDDEHKLGDAPLPDGRVRVFRDNGQEGLSFLGEQVIRYVPIKARIEINLGPDDLVVYETRKARTERLNFRFDTSGRREYVVGWDERTRWLDTIRNYRGKPIAFELRRVWGGHVDYESEMETKLFDYRTAEATFTVGARGKLHYPCTLTTHHGRNAKQSRIWLK
ncbi:MAG: hypothetical protein ACYTEZ_07315 [Planctomycetota bacterium]|jgi:hypothetical protein